jgi:hypothetical protein
MMTVHVTDNTGSEVKQSSKKSRLHHQGSGTIPEQVDGMPFYIPQGPIRLTYMFGTFSPLHGKHMYDDVMEGCRPARHHGLNFILFLSPGTRKTLEVTALEAPFDLTVEAQQQLGLPGAFISDVVGQWRRSTHYRAMFSHHVCH